MTLAAREEKLIREIRGRTDNKKCMECSTSFPTYVVVDFGTWVCQTCSGIHREFGHKVRSPTVSTFKPEELKALQAGGNDVAKQKWRAKWTSKDFPEPESGNVSRIREFIRMTYIEKRWYSKDTVAATSTPKNNEPKFMEAFTKSVSVPSLPVTSTHRPELKKEISLIDFDDDSYFIDTGKKPTTSLNPLPTTVDPFGVDPFSIPANNPFISNAPFGTSTAPNPFMQTNVINQPSTTPFGQPTPFTPSTFGYNSQPTNQSSATTFDPFDLFDSKPTASNHAQQPTQTQQVPTIPGPSGISIRPPPSRREIVKSSSLRDVERPVHTPPPSKNPSVEGNSAACPICSKPFPQGLSNSDVNRHIDECLNAQALTSEGIETAEPNFSSGRPQARSNTLSSSDKPAENPWSQWFNLSNMEWYFGDIDRKEAEGLLFKCHEDSFLVRKSSIRDAYAVSLFNYRKQTVVHSLIEFKNGGWSFQDTSRVYPTVVDLVQNSPECKGLKIPKRDHSFF